MHEKIIETNSIDFFFAKLSKAAEEEGTVMIIGGNNGRALVKQTGISLDKVFFNLMSQTSVELMDLEDPLLNSDCPQQDLPSSNQHIVAVIDAKGKILACGGLVITLIIFFFKRI